MTAPAIPPQMQTELAKLRDIHLPLRVGWWPIAPGWWVLVALVLLLAGLVIWHQRKRRQSLRYLALRELVALRDRVDSPQSATVPAELAVLLRRTSTTLKAADGRVWIDYLSNGKAALTRPIAEFLALAPYTPFPPQPQQLHSALTQVENWIRRRL